MRAYDFIKQLLLDAVKDPDFLRKNTTMQDPVLQGSLQLRVASLTPDYNLSFDYSDVINEVGALTVDQVDRSVRFLPSAAGFVVSSFREGVIDSPGKLTVRAEPGAETPVDGVRYLCADATRGIVQIGELLNVVGVFPNFAATPSQSPTFAYTAPRAVQNFTIGGVEYVAVAMGAPHHIINIYAYATGAGVASIGQLGVPGVPPLGLSNPVALAFNPATNLLYVACTTGQPGGAVSSTGFVCTVDLTNPAVPGAPTLLFNLCTRTDGSVLHNEVSGPKALAFDSFTTSLWIVNGNDEIGSVSLTTGLLNAFIPIKSAQYMFSGVTDIHIKQSISQRVLYVANSDYGNVVSYDLQAKRYSEVFGLRSIEDNSLSQDLLFFGSAGSVNGVLPDTVTIDGESVDCIIVADSANKRMQRLDESAYSLENSVIFGSISLPVPVVVHGWSVVGDVTSDMLQVEYRVRSTDPWHELPQEGFISPTTTLQVRVQVKILPNRPVRDMSLRKLIIVAEQA